MITTTTTILGLSAAATEFMGIVSIACVALGVALMVVYAESSPFETPHHWMKGLAEVGAVVIAAPIVLLATLMVLVALIPVTFMMLPALIGWLIPDAKEMQAHNPTHPTGHVRLHPHVVAL